MRETHLSVWHYFKSISTYILNNLVLMHKAKFQTALRIILSKSWNLLINIL